jgi:hypothetical protein
MKQMAPRECLRLYHSHDFQELLRYIAFTLSRSFTDVSSWYWFDRRWGDVFLDLEYDATLVCDRCIRIWSGWIFLLRCMQQYADHDL